MTKKKIDLGEYIITIYHDENEGVLEVNIYDEEQEIIESVIINNQEDDEDDDNENDFGFNLN